jgi:hypothetical protein
MNVEQRDGWGAGTAPQVHRRHPRRSECAATVMKTEDHLPVPLHLRLPFRTAATDTHSLPVIIVKTSVLGGLHHEYCLVKEAALTSAFLFADHNDSPTVRMVNQLAAQLQLPLALLLAPLRPAK